MTFRQAGDGEDAHVSVTCAGCGHTFLPPLRSFTTDVGDDAIRIDLPVPAPTCPHCGADVT